MQKAAEDKTSHDLSWKVQMITRTQQQKHLEVDRVPGLEVVHDYDFVQGHLTDATYMISRRKREVKWRTYYNRS